MKRLLRAITGAAAAASCLVLLGWITSRLVTDRWAFMQYPWWTPTWAVLPVAAALLLLAQITSRGARRRDQPSPAKALRRISLLLLTAAAAYFAFRECRIHSLLGREPLVSAAAKPGGLRILFWNPSANSAADLAQSMTMVPSDLAIVANPTWVKTFNEMAERFGPSWFVMANYFVVLSRNRVLRWGMTDLGLHGYEHQSGATGDAPPRRVDPGRALWLELDTTVALGRTTIVWVLDLPSDERLGRWATAGQVASELRDWNGQAVTPGPGGQAISTQPMHGFPAPDMVIGDLNVPRGSASLSLLAPGTHNAHDDGGAGYTATYPRSRPLVHIDQVLLAPTLRATDYRVIDPGVTRHRMQWVRIEPATR